MPKLPANIGPDAWHKQVHDFCSKNKIVLDKAQYKWAIWKLRNSFAEGIKFVIDKVNINSIMPSIFIELGWVYKQISGWQLKDHEGHDIDEAADNYGLPNLAFFGDLTKLFKSKQIEGIQYAKREIER